MHRIRRLSLALGALFLAGSGTLLAATWQPVPLYGGPILSLAAAPGVPRSVYAGVDPVGILKSVDGGRTWASPGPGADGMTAYRLEISRFDSRLLFAEFGAFSEFFGRSRDGGATWELLR